MEIVEASPASPAAAPITSGVSRPCTAEVAECTCPEFCERDHEND